MVLVETLAIILVLEDGMALGGVVVVALAGAIRVGVLVGVAAIRVCGVVIGLVVDAGILNGLLHSKKNILPKSRPSETASKIFCIFIARSKLKISFN